MWIVRELVAGLEPVARWGVLSVPWVFVEHAVRVVLAVGLEGFLVDCFMTRRSRRSLSCVRMVDFVRAGVEGGSGGMALGLLMGIMRGVFGDGSEGGDLCVGGAGE